jgi:membrane associated rhomboid family serine protease
MAPPARGPGGQSTWIGARPTTAAIVLVAAQVVAFIAIGVSHQSSWVAQHLVLRPKLAFGREPWQLLTSTWVHLGFGQLLTEALGLWIITTAVEQMAGRRVWLLFFAPQLAGLLAMAAVGRLLWPNAVVMGCEPGLLGLLAAFTVLYGAWPLNFLGAFTLRGRTLGLLMIGASLFVELIRQEWLDLVGALAGLGVGWALASGASAHLGSALDRWKLWRLRRRYKVIPGGRDTKRFLN